MVAVGFSFACAVSEIGFCASGRSGFQKGLYNDVKNIKKRLQFGIINRKMYLCNVMIKLRQAKVYE
mgnify:FL=1